MPPYGSSRPNIAATFAVKKTRMMWLPNGEKNEDNYVYSFRQNTWTWQTDRRTPHDGIDRACIASRGKNCVRRYTTLDIE